MTSRARSRDLAANLSQKEADDIADMVLALYGELARRRIEQRTVTRKPPLREATGTGYLGPDVVRHVMKASG